jgi:hypothetical protein
VGVLAEAALLTVLAGAVAFAQQKNLKDGERPLYDEATKSVAAQNWQKALTDLDAWKQKFPDSEFKDDRDFLMLQGYIQTGASDKVLAFGNEFMDRDLPTSFKGNLGNVVATYYYVTSAGAQLIQKNATPEQIAAGDKAARKLLAFAPIYFVPANMPAGQTAQQFGQTRSQMEATANGYLLLEAVIPGQQALAKKDCAAAEAAYAKALTAYPDNSWVARELGRAYNCGEKPFQSMYEFARAAAIDPTLGKTTDGPKFSASVKKMYVTLHGDESGYDELLATAKGAPIPAADFKIATDDERKAKDAEQFAKDNPEIARWQGIKTNLSSQGASFFESMKGAELPKLMATIADAKPACRPKELVLYVPSPDNKAKTNEITLKFATALTGKPEVGATIKFLAVAEAFTPAPFMLTMTVEKDKVEDLKLTPCAVAAPVHKKKSN